MSPQSRLEHYEQRTEWPLAAVAILFLALYSVQVLAAPEGRGAAILTVGLVALYVLFVADYLARLCLADPRGRWFLRHLFDLAIVALPFLRPLRLLSLVVVVSMLQRALGHTIRGKVVAYTVCGAVLIVYAASLAIIDIEADHPDADITGFGDAVWWSITTVTTGYNDLTPLTAAGRIVAVALMIGGISLVGIVTATLASWIVQRVAEEDTANQAATTAQINVLRQEIQRLAESVNAEGGDRKVERVEGNR
jgi:voltage-gated potassium channel